MKRIINTDAKNYLGKPIRVSGWVNSRRDHGGIVFLDLRDGSAILQVVATPNLIEGVKEEFVLEIEGEVQKRPIKMVNPELETGEIELKAQKIKILAKADSLPFDLRELNLTLPRLLDFRPLTLRNRKIRTIFKVEEEIISSFRKTLKDQGFSEFESPSIVPATAEGGAEVFHIDYFNHDAYLSQSPQLYKQIMVGAFEKVFTGSFGFGIRYLFGARWDIIKNKSDGG